MRPSNHCDGCDASFDDEPRAPVLIDATWAKLAEPQETLCDSCFIAARSRAASISAWPTLCLASSIAVGALLVRPVLPALTNVSPGGKHLAVPALCKERPNGR